MEVLDPSEFLAEAQAIPVGTKNKVRHLCGDASLVVYNNVDSWTAWCWRCSAKGWVPKEVPSMKERLARQAQQKELDNAIRSVKPPYPAIHDLLAWPASARVWLYKAGLSPALIRSLGAYYHEGSNRVVLPVRDGDGQVVFWQARNPDYPGDGRPKYISASTPRDAIHAEYGPVNAPTLVLTEDLLSAFKVGSAGHRAYAVMGTAIGQHTVARLLSFRGTIVSWFDPDGAGTKARGQIQHALGRVGLSVRHIVTARDPKTYCLREIRDHIQEATGDDA